MPGWGTIPATLGEFNFDAYKGLDFYDISMVDGSNLPMYATPSGGEADRKVDADGCLSAKRCTTEVHCPAALRVPRHGGPEVGCISPCARFGTDRYCCRGPFAAGCSPAKTWPVDYAKVFKRAEPYAYSWSGDDATSVFTCKGSCDYRITFGVTPPTTCRRRLAGASDGRSGSVGAVDDQHGALEVGDGGGGDGAGEVAEEAVALVGADHDQAALVLFGDLDQALPGGGRLDRQGLGVEARLAGQGGAVPRRFPWPRPRPRWPPPLSGCGPWSG